MIKETNVLNIELLLISNSNTYFLKVETNRVCVFWVFVFAYIWPELKIV